MQNIYSLADQYSHIISQLPGLFLLKSCDSQYFGFSPQFSHLLGWKNQQECIGRYDADLPCQASELAEIFVREDRETLLNGDTKQLHLTKYCNENIKIFITNKRRLIDKNNEVIGIIVYDEDVTHHPVVQKITVDEMVKIRAYTSSKSKHGLKMKITPRYQELNLSIRESEVLYYLIRKENLKTIGGLLNISTRTVEKHTQNIMEKLGCYSRKQLIEYAADSAIFNVLLNSLFTHSIRLDFSGL
jgi:DNA-binding CsgD family transcriptional regulator